MSRKGKIFWLLAFFLLVAAGTVFIFFARQPPVTKKRPPYLNNMTLSEIVDIRKAVWMNPYPGGIPKTQAENPVLDVAGIRLLERYITHLSPPPPWLVWEQTIIHGDYFYVESARGNFHIFLTPYGASFFDPSEPLRKYTVFLFDRKKAGEKAYWCLYGYLHTTYRGKEEKELDSHWHEWLSNLPEE